MNTVAASADIQIRGSPPVMVGVGESHAPPATPGALDPSPDRGGRQPEHEPDQIRQAMEGVNAFLKASGTHVQFAMHQETRRMMVEVLDDVSGEVLRTIPSKELLDLSARIGEMVGVLLDKKG